MAKRQQCVNFSPSCAISKSSSMHSQYPDLEYDDIRLLVRWVVWTLATSQELTGSNHRLGLHFKRKSSFDYPLFAKDDYSHIYCVSTFYQFIIHYFKRFGFNILLRHSSIFYEVMVQHYSSSWFNLHKFIFNQSIKCWNKVSPSYSGNMF